MTDYRKYINALRKCAKEHDNDRTSVGYIIVSDLCRDTANLLELLEQEPKTGRWIPTGYDGYTDGKYAEGNPVYDWWECSECGWEHTGDEETLSPYCPNCGAKMEVD